MSGAPATLTDRIVAFAAAELGHHLIERDARGHADPVLLRRCGEAGVLGLCVPPTHGGAGLTASDAVRVLVEFGFACRDHGLAFAVGAQQWGVMQPLLTFGTAEQRRRDLSDLARGRRIGALALTEPDAGSDVMALGTRAVRDGGRYRLTGAKRFVTNAPLADLFLVLATLDPDRGPVGLTAFLVQRDALGMTIGPKLATMGLRTAALADVTLEGVLAERLGAEGAGAIVFAEAMRFERSLILAPTVGAMRRQLDRAVAYARARVQFGRPIGAFQDVAGRLVDMRLRLEQATLMLGHAARMLDAGSRAPEIPAITKLSIAEAAIANAQDAMQVFGGSGYLTDTELERELRDALAARLYSGTQEMQRRTIARTMGLP